MNRINWRLRKLINEKNRKKLTNTNFSLIASNCNGGFILHDLGMRFNSPFINLWIKPKDFIRILSDFREYMDAPLTFVKEDGIDYPIGKLLDAKIYFMHYESEAEAESKWKGRKQRIDYDNMFILFTDRDGCTYDDLLDFDRLPFKNKIVFTKRPYPDIKSAVYIKGFENQDSVGDCFAYMPKGFGKKYYDQFDYISWFNGTLE
jgi:uncharacterized protein (DUF1919 family)